MIEYYEHHTVSVSDINCFGLLKPSAILDMMQEVATSHAEILGIGYKASKEKNRFWVITRSSFSVSKCPKLGDRLKVVTYPLYPGKVEAQRDYKIIDDATGEEMIFGTTKWCVIDTSFRRPVRMETGIFGDSDNYFSGCLVDNGCPRLEGLAEKNPVDFAYRIGLSDLDRNFHTNNIKYMDMAYNCFTPAELNGRAIMRVDLNFITEAVLGDELSFFKSAGKEGEVLIESVSKDGRVIFRAAIHLC